MNANLQKALAELSKAGAQGLPSADEVESPSKKDGFSWAGKKSNGEPWELIKNNIDSYNCMC